MESCLLKIVALGSQKLGVSPAGGLASRGCVSQSAFACAGAGTHLHVIHLLIVKRQPHLNLKSHHLLESLTQKAYKKIPHSVCNITKASAAQIGSHGKHSTYVQSESSEKDRDSQHHLVNLRWWRLQSSLFLNHCMKQFASAAIL